MIKSVLNSNASAGTLSDRLLLHFKKVNREFVNKNAFCFFKVNAF